MQQTNEKSALERRKHCARAGCSTVRTPPARSPATHTHTHTHTQREREREREDRLQYTSPQLASAQCKYCVDVTMVVLAEL